MKTVCKTNRCNGCMACLSICPKHCISIRDAIEYLNAEIDVALCINCKLCQKVCPNINIVSKNNPIEWKQGWADEEIRCLAASGGAASAIIKSFISSGGFVAACLFENGTFSFEITNDEQKARLFAGSKYVKSNPINIYEKISEKLKTNKVLFIGLPCQVAGVKNYIKNQQNLYTIDLICHGTPSVKLLDMYLKERGYNLSNLKDVKFRSKTDMGLIVDGKKINPPRITDEYLCAFLEGIDYTENCYSCQFASLERVSDMTLGDSWGSEYTSEKNKGISLILVQNNKGLELMNNSNINLRNVNLNDAVHNNHQLSHPTKKNPKRRSFFQLIHIGKGFKKATFSVLPQMIIKQKIKLILLKLHLIKPQK